MKHGTPRVGIARRGVGLVVAMTLVLFASPTPLLAQTETASIEGAVIDPDGSPASGSRVVVRDLATGKTYTSSPVAADGRYTILVPTGARYTLEAVIAPDGSRVPVEGQVPLRVSTPGTYRMDVRLVAPVEAPAAPPVERPAPTPAPKPPTPEPSRPTPPAPPSPPAPSGAGPDEPSPTPWYKRPGAIVAIVVGTVGLAVAASGGGDGPAASPNTP